MTSTVRRKASEIAKNWHVVDAAGRPLGRVATEAATLLRGKHKPTYEPHLDDGDFVIIINAGKVQLSGRKAEQKVYYRHSGYPGNLRKRTFAEQMARRPERVLERSVWGMLPKGPLGKRIRRHLKVYAGAEHPHQAQITGSERAAEAAAEAEAEALQALIENPPRPPRLRPLSVPDTPPRPPRPPPLPAPEPPPPRPTRREKVAAWLAELEEARATAEADAAAMAEVEEDDLPEEEDAPEDAPEDEPVAEAEPTAEAEVEAEDESDEESEEK